MNTRQLLNISKKHFLKEQKLTFIEKLLLEEEQNNNNLEEITKELEKLYNEKVKIKTDFQVDTDQINYFKLIGTLPSQVIFNLKYENGETELFYSNEDINDNIFELDNETVAKLENFKKDFDDILQQKF